MARNRRPSRRAIFSRTELEPISTAAKVGMGSTTVYMDKGRSSLVPGNIVLGKPAKTDLPAGSRAMESEPRWKIQCFEFRRRYEPTQPGQRPLIVVSARALAPSR